MWAERKFGRSGMVEWKYEVPLRRGERRPRVVFIPSAMGTQERRHAVATTRFGYTRNFATVAEAMTWVEQREAFFSAEGQR